MRNPEKWERRPHPNGPTYSITGAALFLNRGERAILNTLSKHRDRFDEPMYGRLYIAHGDHRLYRILSEHDMRVLREIYAVYVKRKVNPSYDASP